MLVYEEEVINEFLKCPVCQERYDEPKLLPCGKSVCTKCLSQMELTKIQGSEPPMRRLVCTACSDVHVINKSDLGRRNEFIYMFMISENQRSPTDIYRGKAAESLKSELKEINSLLVYFDQSDRDKIRSYCESMRAQVEQHAQRLVETIETASNQLLQQIDDYEEQRLDSFDKLNVSMPNGVFGLRDVGEESSNNSNKEGQRQDEKKIQSKNIEPILHSMQAFYEEWQAYLNKLNIDDDELTRAVQMAQTKKKLVLNEKSQLESVLFQNDLLKYEQARLSDSKDIGDNLIGRLVKATSSHKTDESYESESDQQQQLTKTKATSNGSRSSSDGKKSMINLSEKLRSNPIQHNDDDMDAVFNNFSKKDSIASDTSSTSSSSTNDRWRPDSATITHTTANKTNKIELGFIDELKQKLDEKSARQQSINAETTNQAPVDEAEMLRRRQEKQQRMLQDRMQRQLQAQNQAQTPAIQTDNNQTSSSTPAVSQLPVSTEQRKPSIFAATNGIEANKTNINSIIPTASTLSSPTTTSNSSSPANAASANSSQMPVHYTKSSDNSRRVSSSKIVQPSIVNANNKYPSTSALNQPSISTSTSLTSADASQRGANEQSMSMSSTDLTQNKSNLNKRVLNLIKRKNKRQV